MRLECPRILGSHDHVFWVRIFPNIFSFTQCIALVLGICQGQWRQLKRLLTLCTSLYDEPEPFCAFRNALYLNNNLASRSRLPFFACKNVEQDLANINKDLEIRPVFSINDL